jgi:serine/threonine protein phosphatase 1
MSALPQKASLGPWNVLPGQMPDLQIFAIGDIHAQASAFADALDAIGATRGDGRRRVLVLLGDLIDRGPDHLGTLALLEAAQDRAFVDEVILLPGNHELMLLDALADASTFRSWVVDWGMPMLEELDPDGTVHTLPDARARILAAVGALTERLRTAPSHVRFGDLLFVHAGISPYRSEEAFLAQSGEHALYDHWAWIREPFLDWTDGWDRNRRRVVVHGHTTQKPKRGDVPEWLTRADRVADRRRINLDAGAASGPRVAWLECLEGRYRIGLVDQTA